MLAFLVGIAPSVGGRLVARIYAKGEPPKSANVAHILVKSPTETGLTQIV